MNQKTFTATSGNVMTAEDQQREGVGGAIVARWLNPPSREDNVEGLKALEEWARELAAAKGKTIRKMLVGGGSNLEELQKKADGYMASGIIPEGLTALGKASVLVGDCDCDSPTCGSIHIGISSPQEMPPTPQGEPVTGMSLDFGRAMNLVEALLNRMMRNAPIEAVEQDMDLLARLVKERLLKDRAKDQPGMVVLQ